MCVVGWELIILISTAAFIWDFQLRLLLIIITRYFTFDLPDKTMQPV